MSRLGMLLLAATKRRADPWFFPELALSAGAYDDRPWVDDSLGMRSWGMTREVKLNRQLSGVERREVKPVESGQLASVGHRMGNRNGSTSIVPPCNA